MPPPLVAVRSGDLAPVPLRAPLQIGGRLSLDPGGAVVFTDRNRTSPYAEAAGEVLTLARIGDRVPVPIGGPFHPRPVRAWRALDRLYSRPFWHHRTQVHAPATGRREGGKRRCRDCASPTFCCWRWPRPW